MRILSISTGRADVGHLEPVWREITQREGWELGIISLGSHVFSDEWSKYLQETLQFHHWQGEPIEIVQAMGWGIQRAGWAYQEFKPDLILVAGDRYEALAAVAAALPFCIPVAHIGGGDMTMGVYDNQFRHAITKMAHLHFVAHEQARKRVLAMGEENWRVHVTGLPSLDGVREWLERNGNTVEPGEGLVVIFHPPTLELDTAEEQARELGKALAHIGRPVKAFVPGVDVLHEKVRSKVIEGCGGKVEIEWIAQEAPAAFYRTLARAACLVGNSSAGVIEACSFGLPVVNIGTRQAGRIAPANLLDAPAGYRGIVVTVLYALSSVFTPDCQGLVNPYGDGHAAERIVTSLANLPDKDVVLKKTWAL